MYAGVCVFKDAKQESFKYDTMDATYEDGNASTYAGGDFDGACFSLVPGMVWQCFPEHLQNELCSATPKSDGLFPEQNDEDDVRLGVKRAEEDPPDDTGSRDPQDDDDIIMDEFCVLERFEKLRDQAARNRTSIEELEMKLKDPFVKVKDMTSPRDSRVIARGAACMSTWLEIAGRKHPPSLRVAKVSSPGAPFNGLSGETEEEVKTKEEMSLSRSPSTPPDARS